MSIPITGLTYIQNYEFFSITQAAPRGGKILCDPGDGENRTRVQDTALWPCYPVETILIPLWKLLIKVLMCLIIFILFPPIILRPKNYITYLRKNKAEYN